jgi:anthranilate synthase component 2
MIVLIDNYDSFTYNLVQYFGDLGHNAHVVRNDKITAEELRALKPAAIVISPGPSDPDHAGISLESIRIAAEDDIPLLGVCLGHQCIGQAFGGKVIRAPEPVHGKTSPITHGAKGLFEDLPEPYEVARYHSLIVEKSSLPDCLDITAQSAQDGLIMGLSHKTKPIHGIQFHPESIATEQGHKLLQNFTRHL